MDIGVNIVSRSLAWIFIPGIVQMPDIYLPDKVVFCYRLSFLILSIKKEPVPHPGVGKSRRTVSSAELSSRPVPARVDNGASDNPAFAEDP